MKYDSCELCRGGYSTVLAEEKNTCIPNFVGENRQQCKKGFQLSGNNFCVFHISNCMRYSASQKDANGNAKCELCYERPDGQKAGGVYTASYLLSQDQTKCFPKIKGCAKQLDNKCQQAQDDRVINASGLWICTTCAPGYIFTIDKCVRKHDLPCVVQGETPTSDSQASLITVQVGYGSEATCFENPTHLIPHCTEYNTDGTCKICDSPLGNDCPMNQYGYYDKNCIAKLQLKPKYMLYLGNCVKEIITCRVQKAEKCETCYFFYSLINDNINCKENDQTYPIRSTYSQNVNFYKQWADKPYSNGRVFTKQATLTEIYSQYDDIFNVMQQDPTITGGKQMWGQWKMNIDRQTQAFVNESKNVLKIDNGKNPKMWVSNWSNIAETIWSEPKDDDTWSQTKTAI